MREDRLGKAPQGHGRKVHRVRQGQMQQRRHVHHGRCVYALRAALCNGGRHTVLPGAQVNGAPVGRVTPLRRTGERSFYVTNQKYTNVL